MWPSWSPWCTRMWWPSLNPIGRWLSLGSLRRSFRCRRFSDLRGTKVIKKPTVVKNSKYTKSRKLHFLILFFFSKIFPIYKIEKRLFLALICRFRLSTNFFPLISVFLFPVRGIFVNAFGPKAPDSPFFTSSSPSSPLSPSSSTATQSFCMWVHF